MKIIDNMKKLGCDCIADKKYRVILIRPFVCQCITCKRMFTCKKEIKDLSELK